MKRPYSYSFLTFDAKEILYYGHEILIRWLTGTNTDVNGLAERSIIKNS